MRWQDLLDSHLEGAPLRPPSDAHAQRTVLSISHPPELLQQGLLEMLNAGRVLAASLIKSIPDEVAVHGHAMGLQLHFPTAQIALELALTLVQNTYGMPCSMGLDVSDGWVLEDEWRGIARYRAERLSVCGGHHELLISEALKSAITLPEGVGVFSAPAKRAQQVGHPFWIVRDYR